MDGPLGEGVEGDYNQKPLYRFDLFDCTTFVEMVLALAYTRPESIKKDLSAFEEMVKLIRYGNGEPSFLTRNHFPSADWIPNNTIGNGLLRDVSHEVSLWGSGAVGLALINKQGWYQHFDDKNTPICLVDNDLPYPNCDGGVDDQVRALEQLKVQAEQEVENVLAGINYLPLWQIFVFPSLTKEQLANIPSGSIIQFVRPRYDLRDFINTRMHVSHQGIVIQSPDKGTLLRHVSSSLSKRKVVG
ncbi:MAG: DUF1460 domain-containing protein [Desulfobacteraceae bacterium]|nr:DUF1460 domain-containing protein [Desulfobacteraceae bacterium]